MGKTVDSVRIVVGGRVAVEVVEGGRVGPLQPGRVESAELGDPRIVVIRFDNGAELRIFLGSAAEAERRRASAAEADRGLAAEADQAERGHAAEAERRGDQLNRLADPPAREGGAR